MPTYANFRSVCGSNVLPSGFRGGKMTGGKCPGKYVLNLYSVTDGWHFQMREISLHILYDP